MQHLKQKDMKTKVYNLSFAAILLWSVLLIYSCGNTDFPGGDTPPHYATLKEALQDIPLISKVKENPDTAAMKMQAELNYKEQYSMMFTQDLNHDDEGGEGFEQRVCIMFRGFDRPTILVTEGYYWNGFYDASDLGINLNANMVHVEHRNYGKSYNQDQHHWKYQTTAQASADIHAVYEALKPIFPGKWLSTGTSKSGETSIFYAYHYPYDMNLAISFCSPFFDELYDEDFGRYFMNEISTEENRALMKRMIRLGLTDGENGVYKDLCRTMETRGEKVPTYTEYVFNLFDTGCQIFQYKAFDRERAEEFEKMIADKDYMISQIIDITISNRSPDTYSYWIEAAKEQGSPDYYYKDFADLLEGTSFKADDVLADEMDESDRHIVNEYDNTEYSDVINNFFVNTTCPLLLYYVHDDPWTGGKPSTVGSNVKVVINPIGCHSPILNNPNYCPPSIKQEVMDYVTTYIQP